MEITEKLKTKILEDNEFSLKLAMHLKVSQEWVKRMAKERNQKLLLPHVIRFYKEAGIPDEEIMTEENVI